MNNRAVWILLIVVFFIAGAAGSYLFMRHFDSQTSPRQKDTGTEQNPAQDLVTVRLYLPKDGKLEMSEKSIQRRSKSIATAEGVMEEFFRNGAKGSAIPENVKLLGIYRDQDQVLYLDLSDELRRNFQGDALSEYMLLKAIYETLSSNLQDFQDLKILIDGKEADSLGGHMQIRYPLRNILGTGSGTESRPS